MSLSRRTFLSSTAAAIPLAGCGITINPSTGQVTLPANVVDFVSQAVATIAKYLPTAESIAAAAVSLFGPQFATIVTIGSQAINTLIAFLTNLIPPPAVVPPAAVRLGARLHAAAPGSVLIGYTKNGVPIYGYR